MAEKMTPDKILAEIKAKKDSHKQVLAKAPEPDRPMVELLALPRSTEYQRPPRAEGKGKPKGPDPRRPYYFKGKVGPIQRLSEVPQEELDRHKPLYAQPKAPTKNQELQAVNNARAKAKLGKSLTKAEKDLLGKWELPAIVAAALEKGKK